jgi:hypothetical protein
MGLQLGTLVKKGGAWWVGGEWGGKIGVLNEPLWSLIEDGGPVVRPSVRRTQCGQPTTLTHSFEWWVPEAEEFREAHNPSERDLRRNGAMGAVGGWWRRRDGGSTIICCCRAPEMTWNHSQSEWVSVCVFFFLEVFFVCLFAGEGGEKRGQ